MYFPIQFKTVLNKIINIQEENSYLKEHGRLHQESELMKAWKFVARSQSFWVFMRTIFVPIICFNQTCKMYPATRALPGYYFLAQNFFGLNIRAFCRKFSFPSCRSGVGYITIHVIDCNWPLMDRPLTITMVNGQCIEPGHLLWLLNPYTSGDSLVLGCPILHTFVNWMLPTGDYL